MVTTEIHLARLLLFQRKKFFTRKSAKSWFYKCLQCFDLCHLSNDFLNPLTFVKNLGKKLHTKKEKQIITQKIACSSKLQKTHLNFFHIKKIFRLD